MNPFRCSNCDKLLGMIEGKAEIKCSKCKTMNVMNNSEQLVNFLMSRINVDTDIPPLYSKEVEPSNKTMLTFETVRTIDADTWKDKFKVTYSTDKDNWRGITIDPFAESIQTKVVDHVMKNYDHDHVTRMTREEIKEKYGK